MRGKKLCIAILSCTAVTLTAALLYFAIHSPFFTVQVIEVADLPDHAPVDAQAIIRLAGVEIGKANLFALDLKSIEHRLLTHPWIRKAQLEKRFPQTLSISVAYRDAKALYRSDRGSLQYVDAGGTVFGSLNLQYEPDLPVLSGMDRYPKKMAQALLILETWSSSRIGLYAEISSLAWDYEQGFRAWVTYPIQSGLARAVVNLGQEFDASSSQVQYERLSDVFHYLSQNSIIARQIWADAGKKVVVKTTHSS